MLRAKCSYSEIARILGKSTSSISRHVQAHGGRNDYDAREVRRKKKMTRINAMKSIRVVKGTVLTTIKRLLVSHYSPEQISGHLKKKKVSIAASTIYRYINERAAHLKIHLRCQKGKYRRRRGTLQRMEENALKYKRRIDERPAVVERRGRLGDFEGDTILGSDKRVRIVTYVDRRTGYLIAFLLPKFSTQ
jgi:IS30 family transposase